MNRHMEDLIVHLLHHLKIPVSAEYIKEKLLTHPYYPSLLSVTDTLEELGIENAALMLDKEELNEIPLPFLAYTTSKGGEFIMVTDLEKLFKEQPDFEEQWNGVVVAVEKPEQWRSEENEKYLAIKQGQRQLMRLSATAIIFLSAFSLWNQFAWQYFGLLITSLVGFGVAVLIVQHELGIRNKFTEQLCAAGKTTDCDAVMNSNDLKSFKWFNSIAIGWADAGIIYFSSVFFLLTLSLFSGTIQSLVTILFLLSTCSLPFTFFSVYYQWRIVKKWCPLCLATVGLLWLQFIILLPVILSMTGRAFNNLSITTILFTVFVFAVISTAWLLLIKPVLQKNRGLTDRNFSLLRFKNNPDILKAFLQQQRKVDTTPFENDLQLGNPDADLQIMVACNPYCDPCARAHKILHEFVGKNDIGLTVRFAIKSEDKDDRKLKAVEYILQILNNRSIDYKRKILHDWYEGMNLEKFGKQYQLNSSAQVHELLRRHELWAEKSKIKSTPAIFVNGDELPKQYMVDDLKSVLKNIS